MLRGQGWFGTSKGRKAIDTEMEKQMFGKPMFAGQTGTMGPRGEFQPTD